MYASPDSENRSKRDFPPITGGVGRASLLQMAQAGQGGLGPEGGDPQIMALKGMAQLEQAAQMLSMALPNLTGPLADVVANLRQLVPQAMAQQVSGPQAGAAGGVMMPMPPPIAGMAA